MELKSVVEELYNVVKDRKENPIEGSYTNYLFKEGLDKILKKVGEETAEVIIASKNDNKEDKICEICDLVYHVLVLMANENITLGEIKEELEKRRQKICNKKLDRKPIEKI